MIAIKLSVIVPVYRVADYLEQCVRSLLVQNYENMEIILVNDCSPDNCGIMCDELSELDSRIKVVHKPVNEGLGYARNTGMKHATGDYYTFVDSDDWLAPDSFRQMMELVLQEEPDILQGKRAIEFDDFAYRSKDSGSFKIFTGEEAVISLLNLREIENSAWAKIYNAKLFDNIKFSSVRYGEDVEIMYLLVYECKKVGFYDKTVYHYRRREGSITFEPASIKNGTFLLDICRKRIEFFKDKSEKLHISSKKKYFTRLIGAYYSSDKDESGSAVFFKELRAEAGKLLKEIRPHLPLKERVAYNVLHRSIRNTFDGFILRPVIAYKYKKRSFGRNMRKVRLG